VRAWPLHLVFSTILLGSLAGKERAVDVIDVGDDTLQATAARIGQSQGLDFREYIKFAGNLPVVVFEASGCSGPVLVVAHMVFEEESAMDFARERGDIIRYVYIDRIWDKPNRLARLAERMKYAALASFGLTPYVPWGHLLLVASPPRCEIAAAIDWRNMWNRDYIATVRADPEATTTLRPDSNTRR
jgi:hypothetical protein